MQTVVIDGVTYTAQKPAGRAVIVVDRGWIFAGDVNESGDRVLLTNAVWVFNWRSVGFSKVIEDPSEADIRKIDDVDIPLGSEIFRIPVRENWGLNG